MWLKLPILGFIRLVCAQGEVERRFTPLKPGDIFVHLFAFTRPFQGSEPNTHHQLSFLLGGQFVFKLLKVG